MFRHPPRAADFIANFRRRFTFDLVPHDRLLGRRGARRMLALATAHRRFNYIHPSPDCNGRMMSHAMVHRAGIGAHGLWSMHAGWS